MKEFTHQKYRDLGDIITDSFKYIRIHYKSLGKGLLYFVLPFYLIAALLVGNAYSSIFEVILENPSTSDTAFLGMDFWIGFLLMGLASGALFTITFKHIELSFNNREIRPADLLEDFGRNFLTLLVIYIIAIIILPICFLFFIIPGIYVGIRIFLAPVVAILERKNPIESVARSWNLVEGYWWNSFGVYFVMNVITTMMSYVLVIPFSIIIGITTASGVDTGSSGIGSTISLFYGLLIITASLFSVILLIGMALQYFNLVERKEGRSLREQIEELG